MKPMTAILLLGVCAAAIFSLACGGSSSHALMNTITTTGSNVQAISVDPGPAGFYVNGAFTSVTVCTPGTATCQTIDGILVDTGSSGLRILSSALTVGLTQQTTGGNPVVECLPFVSGFTWGPVQTADLQLSGEKAASLPVQVIGDSTFPVPVACSDHGGSVNSLNTLGANGILGVGSFAQDCGGACVTAGAGNPGLYYQCPSSGCTVVGEALAQQVANPVTFFSTDNNGVIIELPATTSPEATITGSLVFGIGTESNNAVGSATIYNVDENGNFVTTFKNVSYPGSFLDSGSNGFFFLTPGLAGIATCSDGDFYCPSSTQNLSAVTQGAGGGNSATINFSVGNADTLFNDNPSAFVFPTLAGPNSLSGFDWGLPFFYGRDVFTAIEGKSTPSGTGPYWAY